MPLTVTVLRNCSNLAEKKKKDKEREKNKEKRETVTEFFPFPKVLCENRLSQVCPEEGTHLLKPMRLWSVFRK